MLNIKSQVALNDKSPTMAYCLFMSMGARFIQLRRALHLSQEAFGDLCGVTKSAVSQWESDDTIPETDKLIAIKKAHDYSIDWLLTGEGIQPENKPLIELMKVAQKLPVYAVVKLTNEGSSYIELIEEATSAAGAQKNAAAQ